MRVRLLSEYLDVAEIELFYFHGLIPLVRLFLALDRGSHLVDQILVGLPRASSPVGCHIVLQLVKLLILLLPITVGVACLQKFVALSIE